MTELANSRVEMKNYQVQMATSYLEEAIAEMARSQVEFADSLAQFIYKTREHLEIQSTQLKSLEVQVGQMVKILSEEQESLSTLEEPSRVQVDIMELHELVANKEGSTSLKIKEKRKEVKPTPEMILWGETHEKLENHKTTPILELDEIIF